MRIKLLGAKELNKLLRSLPRAVSGKAVRTGLRAGAKVIQKQARANAPVDTGTLKRSLKVRAGRRRKHRIAVVVQTKGGDYKGKAFYGSFVEFGHRHGARATNASLGVKKGKRRTAFQRLRGAIKNRMRSGVAAQPYLGPAFEAKKREAAQIIITAARKSIQNQLNKAAFGPKP